jgi:hypothetical protein
MHPIPELSFNNMTTWRQDINSCANDLQEKIYTVSYIISNTKQFYFCLGRTEIVSIRTWANRGLIRCVVPGPHTNLHFKVGFFTCGTVLRLERFLTGSGSDVRKHPDPDSEPDLNKFSAYFLLEFFKTEICSKKYIHEPKR